MDGIVIHNSAVPVPRRTPEWGWLEYLLHVSLQTSRVRLRAAWSVANKRLAVECAKRCRGLLQLYAWVPISELAGSDSIQEICQNGFRVGHKGVSFHIGNVRLPGTHGYGNDARMGRSVRSRGRHLPEGRRLYEFLLCRVGVGRSYLIESAQQAESLDLPPEYDSFFVRHETNADRAEEEHFGVYPRHILHHEYIVRDAAQALPLYFLHFEYDPEREEKLALPVCDACGVQAAKLFCEADDANFCPACDARVHAVNTIAKNHTRVEINRRPNRARGNCPEHVETEADEYCVEDRIPICVHCRKLGSHSAGEAAKHKRIPIMEAYFQALESRPRGIPGLADRQMVEQRLVAQLDSKLAQVQESGRAAEDTIYLKIEGLVREAQDLAEEQAALYMSDELEAKRQLEEAAWIESYLEDVVKQTAPPEFLKSWLLHTELRDDVAVLASTHRLHKGTGLRVDGSIRLSAGAGSEPAPQRAGGGPAKRAVDMRSNPSPRFLLDA